jgi:cell fate (sporulation/competence/biofilm development) regulator YmcA (YheA/YmcA/DUF963 family)
VVNLWQTEKASIQFKISRVKKQEENYRGFSKGKATDELDDILTIAAKTDYKPLLESFKTYQKEVLMQSIFDRI